MRIILIREIEINYIVTRNKWLLFPNISQPVIKLKNNYKQYEKFHSFRFKIDSS